MFSSGIKDVDSGRIRTNTFVFDLDSLPSAAGNVQVFSYSEEPVSRVTSGNV